ncbi:helix-turn-helix domain-containing protein [Mycolicibacterium fortuitum]|uniref:helix-turn-helix domain-containing protein n=1 Tax=Mycolicibacterium fortuitum TaxID=1766 RepID=UPI0011318E9F|nr:helix-turn-helix transcriptional regulator [Mycolicibacterium fortuitum]TPW95711.1 helix-turn-helix transcriptional regulator [Mycolicibacterium fortuitum]
MRLQSGDTLKALMQQHDFSMGRLARYAGCSKTFIYGLCSGEKRSCTPQLGERIAEALDVPVRVLFVVEGSSKSSRNINTKVSA